MSEKFELDEYDDKAFPTISNSLKGVVSKDLLGVLPPEPLFSLSWEFSDYSSPTLVEKNVKHKIMMKWTMEHVATMMLTIMLH